MKRLVLIDGNAILHRAYHALPRLTTSKGKLVNAVFGFCSMLLKVIHDLRPTHLAVCFDRPEPTFREKIFADYQAQRPKMEEELVDQLELVKKVVKTMKIPIYEAPGFEADDIIGTLVRQAAEVAHDPVKRGVGSPPPDFETIIVTGDRDILQLVGKNIKVYLPVKGLSQAKLYDEAGVEKKYGLKPNQIVDFKALVGDPSDNYPGVKGIGPKTAAQLLKKFGNLEKIYDKIDHVGNFVNKRVVRALEQDKEQAEMAKKLAQIATNVPIKLDLKKARLGKLDQPRVRKLFEELEFKSLISRLAEKETDERVERKKEEEKNTQLSLLG